MSEAELLNFIARYRRRLETRVSGDEVYVEDYGAVGDGIVDDYAAFNSAANCGASTVIGGNKTYRLDSKLVLPAGVNFIGQGMGRTILDMSNAGAYGIDSFGSVSEPSTLNANIVKGDRTVTMTDASGFSEEDIIIIYDAADSSFSSHFTYYRAGEFAQIDHISGNDLELISPVFASYTDDANMHIYLVSPTKAILSGFTLIGDTSSTYGGITVKYGYNFRIENVEVYDYKAHAIQLSNCFKVKVDGINARSVINAATVGNNYGLHVGSSQDIEVANSYMIADRHGFTTGIGTYTFPNRNINVHHSHIYNTARTVTYACDSHGIQEYVSFDHIFTDSLETAGNHTKVTNCTIYGSPGQTPLQTRLLVGFDHEFSNNKIYLTDDKYFFNIGGLDSDTVIGGTLRFLNNTCYMENTTGSRDAVQIINAGSTATDLRVEVLGNSFQNISGVTQGSVTVSVTSGSYYESVKVNNNILNGYSLIVNHAQEVGILNNEIFSGGGIFGLGVNIAAPTSDPSIIRVEGNLVYNQASDGIYIVAGDAGNPADLVVVKGNTVKDNATASGTAYELYIQYASVAVVENNYISGSSANLDSFLRYYNIGTLEIHNNIFDTTLVAEIDFSSITNFRGQITVNLADDGTLTLPTVPAGWGKVWGGGEMMIFQTATDASVTSLVATANAENTNNDDKLGVYDAGSTIVVINRLGSQQKVYLELYN